MGLTLFWPSLKRGNAEIFFFYKFSKNIFVKLPSIRYLFYSKIFHKSISENRLQLFVIETKVIAEIRSEKVENFTLNPYKLENFTYNMEHRL